MKHTLTLLQGVRYTCGPYGGPECHQVEVISVGEMKNQVWVFQCPLRNHTANLMLQSGNMGWLQPWQNSTEKRNLAQWCIVRHFRECCILYIKLYQGLGREESHINWLEILLQCLHMVCLFSTVPFETAELIGFRATWMKIIMIKCYIHINRMKLINWVSVGLHI